MPGRLDPVVARARSLVRAALEDDPRSVVIALSGGADSLALTAVTAFVAERMSRPLRAVVVDHGLQEGSATAAREAVRAARALGVDAEVIEVRVDPAAPRGLDAAARAAARIAFTSAMT